MTHPDLMRESASNPAPSPPRATILRLVMTLLLWLPTATGLLVSAALLVDYVRPLPVFCEVDGGCDVVKKTVYASFLGVPTPAFGLLGFTALALLGLLRGRWPRLAHLALASAAALVSVSLLVVQSRMGVFCQYCVVVDFSAVVVLVGSVVRLMTAWDPPAERAFTAVMGTAFAGAVAVPLLYGFLHKYPIPLAIAEEQKKTPAGQVTVVDFVDFECPFCRITHTEFSPIVLAHRPELHVVRKQVPLRMHSHAMDAARAACCGEKLGKGDELADALFTAPVDDLTPEGCEKMAVSLGLEPGAFRACIHDPLTDQRIQSDTAEFKASQGHGLPTIWIDDQKLEGAQPAEALESAVEHAISDKQAHRGSGRS